MTQTVPATCVLGPGKTGLTIGLRVLNLDGTTYAAFATTGVAETSVAGTYRKAGGVVVPAAGGYIVWGVSGTDLAEATVESIQSIRDAMKLAPSAGDPAAGSVDAHLDAVALEATAQAILEDTGTTLPALIAGVTAPSAEDVADAVWDEALSGHSTPGSTGAALSAAGDPWSVELPGSYLSDQAGGIIGRLAEIDTTAVTATVSSLAGHLAIVAARTFAATVSGLTIPSDWAAAIWTLKTSASEADDAALVRLRASNPSDLEADGLERLNGAALSGLIQASDGSLTVDQAGGSVAIWLSDELTALLAETTGLGWDVKFIDDDDDSSGVRGTADVALTETWLTA